MYQNILKDRMHTLWVADAFTNTPLSGGPAGVCVFDEFPEDQWMQNIAAELGFSNSAFLKKLGTNHFHIKWFTPNSEAPICGHATVAAMHILVTEGLVPPESTVIFESMRGKLYASHSGSWYSINLPSYQVETLGLTSQIRACIDREPLFCGLANNIVLLEVANEDELKSLRPDLEAIKKLGYRAISVTSSSRGYDFMSRYFAPKVGINEDAVCASAHCFLVPYWAGKLNKQEFTAYQASTRGGILKCKNLGNRVLISGEAVTVFKGKVAENNLKELKHVA